MPGETQDQDELPSARRFMQAWDASRTHDAVEQAITRKPLNAGPLNSHMLVLQSLGLMRGLSPDYLRRFLVHVESLQWLDQASAVYPHPQAGKNGAPKTTRRKREKR
jgi:hypothetical protein